MNPEYKLTTCAYRKSDGSQCKRTVAVGQRMCWQHAHGLRAKWRSLSRNQTVGFSIAVVSLTATILFGLAGMKVGLFREPPFAVTVTDFFADTSRQPDAAFFWTKYQSGYGKTLSPMPVGVYVTIHNQSDIPVNIESYYLDIQKEGGEWLRLMSVPIYGHDVYMVLGDFKDSSRLDFSDTGLDSVLKEHPIPPHETARGWAFFTPQKAYAFPEGTDVRYRMTLLDSTGQKSVVVTPYRHKVIGGVPADGSANPHPMYLTIVQQHVDITSGPTTIKLWDTP